MVNPRKARLYAYCSSRAIEIPAGFYREDIDSKRYSVVIVGASSRRLVAASFDAIPKLKKWFSDLRPDRASCEVIDIDEGVAWQADAEGNLLAPASFQVEESPGPVRRPPRRRDAPSLNMETLRSFFGPEWFLPRRLEIISILDEQGVSIGFQYGERSLDSLRIHVPARADGTEDLLAELFDPVSRTPLDYIAANPRRTIFVLADPVRRAPMYEHAIRYQLERRFGPGWLTPRRLQILSVLRAEFVWTGCGLKDMRSFRVRVPGMPPGMPEGRREDLDLIAELFDPVSKTPLEIVGRELSGMVACKLADSVAARLNAELEASTVGAARLRALSSRLQDLLGADWLTPRRREILAALDERGVEFGFLGEDLASLRFYIHPWEPGVPTSTWKVVDGRLRPVMNPDREPDSGELLAELFDPEARRPVEYVDSYPDLSRKYRLALSVVEEIEGSARDFKPPP